MRLIFLAVMSGCSGAVFTVSASETGLGVTADVDADVDADTDTDADADADADADGCPLAGSWVIESVRWGEGDFWSDLDVVGSLEISGTEDECDVEFVVVVNDDNSTDCHIVEAVQLRNPIGTGWDGWSDGGGYPPCRDSMLGPRALGVVVIDVEDNHATLTIDGDGDTYLQFIAMTSCQTVTISRR